MRINPIPEEIKQAVREVESSIYKKEYFKISLDFRKGRLSEQEIEEAIKEYGGQVTLAPASSYNNLLVIEIKNSNPAQYFVDFDLWINGEQSDLTLSLSVIEDEKGKYIATIDDIHIL